MTRSEQLHLAAMEFCDEALAARRKSDSALAVDLFRRAFENERDAASLLSHEPTRSVIHRSAAALAVECGEYRAAEKLIAAALAGDPPREIAEELRDLFEQVNFNRHLDLRGLKLDPNELQISLYGNATSFGMVQSDLFVDRVRCAESLLFRTLERKLEVPFRERGRPRKEITDRLKIYMSAPRAASFAVTLKVGLPQKQLTLPGFDRDLIDHPDTVIDDLLLGVRAFEQGDQRELEQMIPDEAYRRNFVALIDRLAPDGEDIKLVGLTVVRGGEERRISLRQREPMGIKKGGSRNGSTEPDEIQVAGYLRKADAVDTEHPKVSVVRENALKQTFLVPRGMMSDVVNQLWDEFVLITAKKIGKNKYRLERIIRSNLLHDYESSDE
jgi:hypothetical protein